MTAQVIHSRIKVPSLDPQLDGMGVGFTHQYIGAGTPGTTEWTGLVNAIIAFFNTAATGSVAAVSTYLGASLDGGTNHSTIDLYDVTNHLDGTPAGGPIMISQWTLSSAAIFGAMPEGVCAVAGYQAVYGTDTEFGATTAIPTPPDIVADYGAASTHQGRPRPRARDRGRIYLGPLSSNALQHAAPTYRSTLTGDCQTSILHNLFALADITVGSSPTWAMRVWSRRAAAVKLIDHFRVSDRPGYQRRRVDPSTLITTLPGPAV